MTTSTTYINHKIIQMKKLVLFSLFFGMLFVAFPQNPRLRTLQYVSNHTGNLIAINASKLSLLLDKYNEDENYYNDHDEYYYHCSKTKDVLKPELLEVFKHWNSGGAASCGIDLDGYILMALVPWDLEELREAWMIETYGKMKLGKFYPLDEELWRDAEDSHDSLAYEYEMIHLDYFFPLKDAAAFQRFASQLGYKEIKQKPDGCEDYSYLFFSGSRDLEVLIVGRDVAMLRMVFYTKFTPEFCMQRWAKCIADHQRLGGVKNFKSYDTFVAHLDDISFMQLDDRCYGFLKQGEVCQLKLDHGINLEISDDDVVFASMETFLPQSSSATDKNAIAPFDPQLIHYGISYPDQIDYIRQLDPVDDVLNERLDSAIIDLYRSNCCWKSGDFDFSIVKKGVTAAQVKPLLEQWVTKVNSPHEGMTEYDIVDLDEDYGEMMFLSQHERLGTEWFEIDDWRWDERYYFAFRDGYSLVTNSHSAWVYFLAQEQVQDKIQWDEIMAQDDVSRFTTSYASYDRFYYSGAFEINVTDGGYDTVFTPKAKKVVESFHIKMDEGMYPRTFFHKVKNPRYSKKTCRSYY